VTNFGALAVLAELRGHARLRTARVYAVLTALETFPPGADGWREVSTGELCESAGFDRKAFRQARGELIAAKLIEYRPAAHRGENSRWRVTFPVEEPPGKKGAAQSGPLPTRKKGAAQSGPSTTAEGGRTTRGRTARPPSSALTSQDAASGADSGRSTALEPLRSPASLRTTRTGSSGPAAATADDDHPLQHTARDPRLARLLLGLGATEAQAELIAARLHDDPGIHSPYTYVLAVVGDGDGGAWLGRMLADLNAQDPSGDPRPPPPKPPWCGECDQQTRLIELPDGPARCIRCHPLSVHPPGPDPPSSAWVKPWCGRCDPVSRWAEAEQPDGTVKLTRCPDCGERR
jgi:hypothetical protein